MSKLNVKLSDFIKRHYTKELEGKTDKTVYDLFEWKKVDVVLKDYKAGKTLFEGLDLEFPAHYTQNACDIIASKYFRKAGVPNERGYEFSMKEVVHRLVGFWTAAAHSSGLITSENMDIFYDEVAYSMLAQMVAPNSPQWFNTGLKFAYNLDKEPEGYFYYDVEQDKVVLSKDAYTRSAASACFILSINDALLGKKSITDQIVSETRLFKYGSGTGTNYSNIRGVGELLSGGGTSSGLKSFLKVFDANAGAIKSGGTTRRAARMVSLDDDHPEVEDFIMWKANEEEKVVALGKMGYDTDFNGEAYATVGGQNSNNSIVVTDEFLRKASGEDQDPTWLLKGRVDPSVNKEVSAVELFNKWNYAAWRSGDPAPQYTGTINAWHTCPLGEDGDINNPENRIRATNPCSEYAFINDTACNLASINVGRFYNSKTSKFDVEGYVHVISLWQIVLEATIHWGQFPTEDIARRSHLFRTTGLGVANTAALHMKMAHPYDSDEARAVASAVVGIMTGQAYFISALMAKEIGPFAKYELNKEHMLKVIRNHSRVAGAIDSEFEGLNYKPVMINHELLEKEGFKNLSIIVKEAWSNAYIYGLEYGYRNAQTSVIAPTGTIAFAMDSDATSTEPFYSHVAYKKLAGGGMMEIVNPAIKPALEKLGYSEKQIEDIVAYVMRKETVTEDGHTYEVIADGKIEGAPHLKEEHYPIFDTANTTGTGERYIEPMGHVRMMAALTPLVSGAISKTVNLPNDATVEDFANVHLTAWKMGVKAIALYRDGCKASQPLNSSRSKKEQKLEDLSYKQLLTMTKDLQEQVKHPVRNRPSGIRPSRVHEAKIEGLKLYITVSYHEDGSLAELYATADREGTLIKGLLDSLSKLTSMMLQYKVDPRVIAKTLRGQKYEPHGFVQGHPYIKRVDSLSDLIAKIIEIELGDFSHCQVKPENYLTQKEIMDTREKDTTINQEVAVSSAMDSSSLADGVEEVGEKVYGHFCPTCGSTKMKKNGTCYVCSECGSTTGCS